MESSVKDTRYFVTGENKEAHIIEQVLIALSFILVLITLPFSLIVSMIVMNEFERAVVFRLGRLLPGPPKGPGIYFILPCTDNYVKVDLRTSSLNVPPQDILTKDSVSVNIDAVIYYRIVDPFKATIQIENVYMATALLAQTTLRKVSGVKYLTELLSDKDAVAIGIREILDKGTDPWGVKVERVEIIEINIPGNMQRAMAIEQEAEREAKAKVAAANGELLASTALRDASIVMSKSSYAIQLRYLQTINSIANKQGQTVIIPFPVNVIRKIFGK